MNTTNSVSTENKTSAQSGWVMLPVNLALLFLSGFTVLQGIRAGHPGMVVLGAFLVVATLVSFQGHFTLQPNESRLLILFGEYKGTVRDSGFFWANPFYAKNRAQIPLSGQQGSSVKAKPGEHGTGQTMPAYRPLSAKISLRARNFNSEILKVNDKQGNPVEIGAVIVWRVADTAKAAFDVDDFENYVRIQTESAVRHMASLYAYDNSEANEPTLRGSADEIAQALKKEVQERLDKAGVVIEEARLTHLAYSPEIAQVMLRRQQAEAVIAARRTIVRGAVSMVEMALNELSEKDVVKLDEERKAAMVSNLLVVLCGESEVTPVVNTGTLYT